MNGIMGFFQEIFMLKQDNSVKVGLSQFKTPKEQPKTKEVSIRNKNVKLSDLMRRAS